MALVITSAIGQVRFDATTANNLQADVDVTDHPVETGADISDHVRPRPDIIQVEGILSDTPIPAADRADVAGVEIRLRTRARDALALLRRIRLEGQRCTVDDLRTSYTDMIITGLSVPRDPSLGSAIRVALQFKQIVIVSSQTQVAKVQRVNKKKSLVKIVPKPSPAEDNRSLGAKLDDYRKEIFK